MRVLHIIADLDVGGAELMLSRLVRFCPSANHIIISLTTLGSVGKNLSSKGFSVHSLGCKSPLSLPLYFFKLVKLIKKTKPDIVQTWMYHADLIGGIAAWLCGVNKLCWGIRNTKIPNSKFSATGLVIWISSKLSFLLPCRIVCCSVSAMDAHKEIGFCKSKMLVIENGYDVEVFSTAREKRLRHREALGFHYYDTIIGVVGRFDPLKDYGNFINAAAKVAVSNEHSKFLMIGRNVTFKNNELRALIEQTGFADRFLLLGERNDVPSLLSAMDVFCLSSKAEGFPNVVAEAMASGLPCVVTDVGDAARIVRDTGVIVPPENSDALARGLLEMIDKGDQARRSLGERAMIVVQENFSIQVIAARYENLYEKLVCR